MQLNSLDAKLPIDRSERSLLEPLQNSSFEDLTPGLAPNSIPEEWQISASQQHLHLPQVRRSRRQTISDYIRRKYA